MYKIVAFVAYFVFCTGGYQISDTLVTRDKKHFKTFNKWQQGQLQKPFISHIHISNYVINISDKSTKY